MASQPALPTVVSLYSLALRRSGRVVEVPAAAAKALAAEGVVPGELLEVETRQPFSGPVVLRIGRARLALAQSIALRILVEPVAPELPTR